LTTKNKKTEVLPLKWKKVKFRSKSNEVFQLSKKIEKMQKIHIKLYLIENQNWSQN